MAGEFRFVITTDRYDEVDDVEATFRAITTRGAPVLAEPTDYPWGHRGCAFTDPNGVVVGFFTPIAGPG